MTQLAPPPDSKSEPSPEQTLRDQLATEISSQAAGPGGETTEAMFQRVRAEAVEILELCQIAGQPGLTAGFIRQGLTPAAVRKALLTARAETFEAAPTMPVNTNTDAGDNPLISAIRASLKKGA